MTSNPEFKTEIIGKSESAEAVAFDLMILIAKIEHVSLVSKNRAGSKRDDREVASREWLLDTYKACLSVTKNG